ncbi:MAG TPA: methyltransferase [Gammaproteobacteria bacterium]
MFVQEERSGVREEFSQNAGTYGRYNIIQNQVVGKLLQRISDCPRSVLDLGCGDGAVYKAITWPLQSFTAVDFAPGMLELHPAAPEVEMIFGDFNDPDLFKKLQSRKFDRVVSASALQWAGNMDSIFGHIHKMNAPVSLAIFTSGTFSEIYRTAAIPPILLSAEEIINSATKYFSAEYTVEKYTLNFQSVREMFRYIKKSGVSGGRKILDYRQAKRLMQAYPLQYLEFEVLFMHT